MEKRLSLSLSLSLARVGYGSMHNLRFGLFVFFLLQVLLVGTLFFLLYQSLLCFVLRLRPCVNCSIADYRNRIYSCIIYRLLVLVLVLVLVTLHSSQINHWFGIRKWSTGTCSSCNCMHIMYFAVYNVRYRFPLDIEP